MALRTKFLAHGPGCLFDDFCGLYIFLFEKPLVILLKKYLKKCFHFLRV